MAFVPNCQSDVFISYSRLNDVAPVGGEGNNGWVTNFVKQFEVELNQRKGIIKPEIFIDYNGLAPGDKLTESIMNAIQNSATLIVILSEKYLESDWCKSERKEFIRLQSEFSKIIKCRSKTNSRKSQSISRVFIVGFEPLPINEWPEEFKDILTIDFWDMNREKLLGSPVPTASEAEYYTLVRKLSRNVAKRLLDLKERSERGEWQVGDSEIDATTKSIKDIKRPTQDNVEAPSDAEGFNIIIDSHNSVVELQEKISRLAIDHGFGYTINKGGQKKAEDNRIEFENKIKGSDGIVIIHAYNNKARITGKINSYKKALALRENSISLYGRALVAAPPLPRPLPDDMIPRMKTIECVRGTSDDELNKFFKKLRTELEGLKAETDGGKEN